MGAAFVSRNIAGRCSTAYGRLQYVCHALALLKRHSGAFPYQFEGPDIWRHITNRIRGNRAMEVSRGEVSATSRNLKTWGPLVNHPNIRTHASSHSVSLSTLAALATRLDLTYPVWSVSNCFTLPCSRAQTPDPPPQLHRYRCGACGASRTFSIGNCRMCTTPNLRSWLLVCLTNIQKPTHPTMSSRRWR